jgi:hypothetical protein
MYYKYPAELNSINETLGNGPSSIQRIIFMLMFFTANFVNALCCLIFLHELDRMPAGQSLQCNIDLRATFLL